MLSLDEIKKNYSYPQGFDKSILREYLQYKILDIIFKSNFGEKLSFLGGTAIKICYKGRRFSEDLDFDNFNLTEKEFEEMSVKIQKELSLEGYEVEVRNVFKGAFRCYIKIPDILFENMISPYSDEKLMIQIDTMPHNFIFTPETILLQKFDVFRNIKATPIDIILSQKIAAILERKRAKGRDFYDLVYLMGLTDFNFDYLKQKLNIENKTQLKKTLLDFCVNLNFKELTIDVLPFLIKQDEKDYILNFKEYIEQKL
ncbi:MAG: nucleotidyl transferase AbiEii/AbiGii toxin family protein [Candidatus Pacebacteria bacterium]|nr:nucleotidyl transferase AbiEii/AbiGii toxin family protein [Candidatus Paceibacterota bacterium]